VLRELRASLRLVAAEFGSFKGSRIPSPPPSLILAICCFLLLQNSWFFFLLFEPLCILLSHLYGR
jgi:hypothetical protein